LFAESDYDAPAVLVTSRDVMIPHESVTVDVKDSVDSAAVTVECHNDVSSLSYYAAIPIGGSRTLKIDGKMAHQDGFFNEVPLWCPSF